ncbi:hypothetical protein V8E52_001874 [Russula decolorans]|jgi:hypothetical protein
MPQWRRRYLQQAEAQTTLYKRAHTREYLRVFEGVKAFRLSQALEALPALLYIAVFLFFSESSLVSSISSSTSTPRSDA